MEGQGGHDTYPECKHIPRSVPREISEEQALRLAEGDKEEENVLPLFERKLSEYKRIKLYSLQTNELLKYRWKTYVENIEGMTPSPYKFPNLGDLHFHNCNIKIMPSLTPRNHPTHRRQMGIGPGVDQYGQMPIPNDMHVSISKITKTKLAESSKSNKK